MSLTPLVTQKDGTSAVKSDWIRSAAALEVEPKSGRFSHRFHGDASSRECRGPTALHVVKLQSDDKRAIIQTKTWRVFTSSYQTCTPMRLRTELVAAKVWKEEEERRPGGRNIYFS